MPKPFKNSRPPKRRPQLPLDPSYLVQKPLEPGKELAVAKLKTKTFHPTIYRKRVDRVDGTPSHGDLVEVRAEGETVGFGYWNPRAGAQVKIVRWGSEQPNVAWWKQQLAESIALRERTLGLPAKTDAYRIINAEGDGFPGLVVDRYGPIISIQAFTLAMYQRAEAIAKLLVEQLDVRDWIVRPGPSTEEQEGFIADGFASPGVPKKLKLEEHGVRFEVLPFEGHKTGFFCDQRDNRVRLRDFCAGKSVLDVCCYSGGFAMNAAKAGASDVTGVDLDEEAIAMAKRNANLNQVSAKFVHADAFSYMRDMQRNGRQFDVVILDPPKLIRNRDEMHEGQNKYFDFNKLAISLVKPGGMLLTCSCSGLFSLEEFTKTVRAATSDERPRMLLKSGPGLDHPVALNCLETDYLKCLWLQKS